MNAIEARKIRAIAKCRYWLSQTQYDSKAVTLTDNEIIEEIYNRREERRKTFDKVFSKILSDIEYVAKNQNNKLTFNLYYLANPNNEFKEDDPLEKELTNALRENLFEVSKNCHYKEGEVKNFTLVVSWE